MTLRPLAGSLLIVSMVAQTPEQPDRWSTIRSAEGDFEPHARQQQEGRHADRNPLRGRGRGPGEAGRIGVRGRVRQPASGRGQLPLRRWLGPVLEREKIRVPVYRSLGNPADGNLISDDEY